MKQYIVLFLVCWTIPVLSGCVTAPPSDSLVCGGLAGQTCPGDQYCAYPEGAGCGRGDMPGVCVPKPEFCTQEYMPVCGCDIKTYNNACMATLAGVSVDYERTCGGEREVCGGIDGLLCPEGRTCVDDPGDDCHPSEGDTGCMGICK